VSECSSGVDGSGPWVQCGAGSALIRCPPTCVCNSARATVSRSGVGSTCSQAYNAALKLAKKRALDLCPAGVCNEESEPGECEPVSDERDDGFTMSVDYTYSCKDPSTC
jgi:hypothetical protein